MAAASKVDAAQAVAKAVTLIEDPYERLADAASLLRDSPEHDELAMRAVIVEGEAGILLTCVKRATLRQSVSRSVAADSQLPARTQPLYTGC